MNVTINPQRQKSVSQQRHDVTCFLFLKFSCVEDEERKTRRGTPEEPDGIWSPGGCSVSPVDDGSSHLKV